MCGTGRGDAGGSGWHPNPKTVKRRGEIVNLEVGVVMRCRMAQLLRVLGSAETFGCVAEPCLPLFRLKAEGVAQGALGR